MYGSEIEERKNLFLWFIELVCHSPFINIKKIEEKKKEWNREFIKQQQQHRHEHQQDNFKKRRVHVSVPFSSERNCFFTQELP